MMLADIYVDWSMSLSDLVADVDVEGSRLVVSGAVDSIAVAGVGGAAGTDCCLRSLRHEA